jgi:hypothetical protein
VGVAALPDWIKRVRWAATRARQGDFYAVDNIENGHIDLTVNDKGGIGKAERGAAERPKTVAARARMRLA